MSALAVNALTERKLRFYETTVGKKFIMAGTGVVLFGFVVGHLAGNLQFFAGRETVNHYAVQLRTFPALLWAIRIGLLAAVIAHIVTSIQLVRLQNLARPVAYAKKRSVGSNYASRTMYWSGPIIAVFVVYHLLHMTWGTLHPRFEHLDVYDNLVYGFANPLVSAFYILAIGLLLMHLYHGLWSMFQTFGVSHPLWTPRLKILAKVVSIALFLGFSSIPVAVLAGIRP